MPLRTACVVATSRLPAIVAAQPTVPARDRAVRVVLVRSQRDR